MAIKSIHLSLASTNTNVYRVTDDSGLNVRVNDNATFCCLVGLT